MLKLEEFEILASGLNHPETVAWGLDGNYYAGGEGGQIYRIAPDGGVEQYASTGGLVLGVCLDAENNLYACDSGRKAVLKVTPAGQLSVYSDGSPARRMLSPNHLVFTPGGDLYVSDSGERGKDNGCLYRLRPGGQAEVVNPDLRQNPNGLAIYPDGEWLYVLLSELSSLVRVKLKAEGPLDEVEKVVKLEGAIPDGIAFDEQGSAYLACDTPNTVYCLSPGGELSLLVEDWRRNILASPTSLAFGGAGLDSLVASNFGRYTLVRAPAPVPGTASHYPRI